MSDSLEAPTHECLQTLELHLADYPNSFNVSNTSLGWAGCPLMSGTMPHNAQFHLTTNVTLPNNNVPTAESSQRGYKCLLVTCTKIYKNKGDMERHLLTHGPPLFWCPVLGCKFNEKGFHRKDHHIKHLRTHPLPKSWIQAEKSLSPKDFVCMTLRRQSLGASDVATEDTDRALIQVQPI